MWCVERMILQQRLLTMFLCCVAVFVMAGCNTEEPPVVAQIPTATLVPLVTLSPVPTATPVVSNTPLPTFTPIPSDTLTPSYTPVPPSLTPTPPVTGIVGGSQRINFRASPNDASEIIGALTPGDGLLILGQNSDGSWLNVRSDSGLEGWVATRLIFIPPTRTPQPTATPTTDLTAIALGTTFPTAVIGGQPVTPTPPPAALSPTPTEEGLEAVLEDEETPLNVEADVTVAATHTPASTTEPLVPIINIEAINQTATAIAGGRTGFAVVDSAPRLVPLTQPATGQSPNVSSINASATTTPLPPEGAPIIQDDVYIFALCDNPDLGGTSAPRDLAVGSSITIWWGWVVSEPIYITQHEDAVTYTVTINGVAIPDWRNYGGDIEAVGNSYVRNWYVPAGILDTPGLYRVEFRAEWNRVITDGYDRFGEGTSNVTQTGSCTFMVRG
jgi:hypothetical protein